MQEGAIIQAGGGRQLAVPGSVTQVTQIPRQPTMSLEQERRDAALRYPGRNIISKGFSYLISSICVLVIMFMIFNYGMFYIKDSAQSSWEQFSSIPMVQQMLQLLSFGLNKYGECSTADTVTEVVMNIPSAITGGVLPTYNQGICMRQQGIGVTGTVMQDLVKLANENQGATTAIGGALLTTAVTSGSIVRALVKGGYMVSKGMIVALADNIHPVVFNYFVPIQLPSPEDNNIIITELRNTIPDNTERRRFLTGVGGHVLASRDPQLLTDGSDSDMSSPGVEIEEIDE